jgi:hypothetical protein
LLPPLHARLTALEDTAVTELAEGLSAKEAVDPRAA